jgi:hypothetical protein
MIPGPVPELADAHCVAPPETVSDVLLLGDGDSDRAATANVLQRFAGRWARPGRSIRAGLDAMLSFGRPSGVQLLVLVL